VPGKTATVRPVFGEVHIRSAFRRRDSLVVVHDDAPRAAVAPVFRDGPAGVELLFIERARRHGDPWSGQMAFPGGRVDPGDPDTASTAERETFEEVGLDLAGAERIGRLDDLEGGRATGRSITVAAHAYWIGGADPLLAPNHEVADVVWVPLGRLADPAHHLLYDYPPMPEQRFPGIGIPGSRVVWGLTYRFLEDLFVRLGVPLPPRDLS